MYGSEANANWQQRGKLHYAPAAAETEARVPKLAMIARQQAEPRKAA